VRVSTRRQKHEASNDVFREPPFYVSLAEIVIRRRRGNSKRDEIRGNDVLGEPEKQFHQLVTTYYDIHRCD